MIPEEKMREIAKALLKKSQANDVEWQQVPGRPGGVPSYVTSLGNSHILVSFYSPEVEEDFYQIRINNELNQVIGLLRAAKNRSPDDWDVLRELFAQAERLVTRWDIALGEIEESLGLSGETKAETNSNHPSGSAESPGPPLGEEDIPF